MDLDQEKQLIDDFKKNPDLPRVKIISGYKKDHIGLIKDIFRHRYNVFFIVKTLGGYGIKCRRDQLIRVEDNTEIGFSPTQPPVLYDQFGTEIKQGDMVACVYTGRDHKRKTSGSNLIIGKVQEIKSENRIFVWPYMFNEHRWKDALYAAFGRNMNNPSFMQTAGLHIGRPDRSIVLDEHVYYNATSMILES